MRLSNYSQELLLKRPSLEYYAFRHLSYSKFQAISLIYAIFQQLIQLPLCSDDLGVVRHKTQFWINELRLAYNPSVIASRRRSNPDDINWIALPAARNDGLGNQPSHPLTQDLQRLLQVYPLPLNDWLKICTAVEAQTDRLLLETQAELERYADRLFGSLTRLLAVVLHHPHNLDLNQPWVNRLALGQTLLNISRSPEKQLIRISQPENFEKEVYTLFEPREIPVKGLRILSKIYQAQAKEPMVHLGPLKILWLATCERLSSRT